MLPPHRCCCATLASLLLCMPVPFLPCCCCAWRSRITAAVPLLRCCCCAALTSLLPYRSRVAPAACGALAALLLWHSQSHCCCSGCGALASLLLCCSRLAAACGAWRSRIAAAVPLSPRCGCGVLLFAPCCCCTWCSHIAAALQPCDSHLAIAGAVVRSHRCCYGALASLLPCPSRPAAAASFSPWPLAAAVQGRPAWRSRIAAALRLSLG